MSTNSQQPLFIQLASIEEEQVAGGFGYNRGFRRHLYRAQSVPVADTPMSQPSSDGSAFGGGRGGGFSFDLQSYIFGIGAAYLFGNPGVTPAEIQYVWQMALRL